MKAVILAAGKGTRMGELTAHVPKPMKEVEGRPILQHIVEGLRDAAGVRDFFIVIGWCGHVITNHFGDGSALGVRVAYGEQKVQDGTGKAPELARDWVGDDRFLFTYGDILIKPPTDYAADGGLSRGRRDRGEGWRGPDQGRRGRARRQRLHDRPRGKVRRAAANAFYNAGIYLLKPRIFDFTSRLQKSPRGEYEFTDALRASVAAGDRLRGVTLALRLGRRARSRRARGTQQAPVTAAWQEALEGCLGFLATEKSHAVRSQMLNRAALESFGAWMGKEHPAIEPCQLNREHLREFIRHQRTRRGLAPASVKALVVRCGTSSATCGARRSFRPTCCPRSTIPSSTSTCPTR